MIYDENVETWFLRAVFEAHKDDIGRNKEGY